MFASGPAISIHAVPVTKLTLAFITSGWLHIVCSTERTHPPHFIPSISSKSE